MYTVYTHIHCSTYTLYTELLRSLDGTDRPPQQKQTQPNWQQEQDEADSDGDFVHSLLKEGLFSTVWWW